MINGHGDDLYLHDTPIVSNFSSNVYHNYNHSRLEDYLTANIKLIHSYPEPDSISLRSLIAKNLDIDREQIIATNGATEAIYLIAQTFRDAKTAIVIPTFSEYEDACRIHNHQLQFIENLENLTPDINLVWLCNPNNPTGKIYTPDYLETIVAKNPDIHFVIDQSYADFNDISKWSVSDAIKHKNVILIHSLTKCYSIPGIRLGYITSSPLLTDKIRQQTMPWSVNSIAQLAGSFLLNETPSDYSDSISNSARIQDELQKVKGVKVHASDMHYFLCELEQGKASDLKGYLIKQHGFLIRDAANFRGLTPQHFRIAALSETENIKLIEAIKEWTRLHS